MARDDEVRTGQPLRERALGSDLNTLDDVAHRRVGRLSLFDFANHDFVPQRHDGSEENAGISFGDRRPPLPHDSHLCADEAARNLRTAKNVLDVNRDRLQLAVAAGQYCCAMPRANRALDDESGPVGEMRKLLGAHAAPHLPPSLRPAQTASRRPSGTERESRRNSAAPTTLQTGSERPLVACGQSSLVYEGPSRARTGCAAANFARTQYSVERTSRQDRNQPWSQRP